MSCIDSIKWLGHHLPESVVAFLVDEIEVEEAGRGPMSDTEVNGFASSSDFLDYGTSQMHQRDEDHTTPGDDMAAYHLQNQQQPHPGHENHDHSGLHEDDVPKCVNGSAVLRKNENRKEANARGHNPYRMVDVTGKDHDGLSQHSGNHAQTFLADQDDSFARDESAGYHADYNESKNGFVNDFSEFSYGEKNALPLVHDENDSCDEVNGAANDPLHRSDRPYRSQRRHSVMGFEATLTSPEAGELESVAVEQRKARRRVGRRSSMPLIVRSMTTTDRKNRRGSMKPTSSDHVSDSSSGSGSSLRFHKDTNHRKHARRMKRRGSAVSGNSISSLMLEPLGAMDGLADMNSSYGRAGSVKGYVPYASDDEKREFLRKSRVLKTRDSIMRLSGDVRRYAQTSPDELESEDEGEFENYFVIPPATRHDCALLFVDISGFTALSTSLEVEPLSKVSTAFVTYQFLSHSILTSCARQLTTTSK